MGNKTILVGLTGGIGAGKSTVARLLEEKGYTVLSADILAREVVAPGSPALHEIVEAFGNDILLTDGTLDRKALRDQIFADDTLRQKLEKITHPRIQALMTQRADALFAEGNQIVFYEAPLLFEARSEKKLSAVACVWARDEVRIQRVMARDKCGEGEAKKILLSQMPQEEKKSRSDFLVENSDGLDELKAQIASFLEAVTQKFSLPTS